MRISGFTFCKNADKLYYPIKQSILSILPIVDEFIVNIGDCDDDDKTVELIQSINSPKIKLIFSKWNLEKYPNGTENAHQTDIAKNACSGDWLFYLQADEVVHEKYLDNIVKRCEELIVNKDIEGLLFDYIHFYGDYWHYQNSHGWYKKEIRIIRNDTDIHSWESAQSFRRIPNFDGVHYRQQEGTFKLKVAKINAAIYHYGWVRPPELMQKKKIALDTIHKGGNTALDNNKNVEIFAYAPLGTLPVFKDTHPAVMNDWIKNFNWQDKLNYSKKPSANYKKPSIRHRILTKIEKIFFKNKISIGEFKNYKLILHTDKKNKKVNSYNS
jgi:hypothetical protein